MGHCGVIKCNKVTNVISLCGFHRHCSHPRLYSTGCFVIAFRTFNRFDSTFSQKVANAQRYSKLWRLDHRGETNITFYSFVLKTRTELWGFAVETCGLYLPRRSNLRSISCTKREINRHFRYLQLQSTNTWISHLRFFRFFADIQGIS